MPSQFAKHLLSLYEISEIEQAISFIDPSDYADDPLGFCSTYFNEEYTDQVKILMESVRDYPVTIARSANAVGKSHAAARIALWAYKSFEDVQVYLAAAPPEDNLRRILWGELEGTVTKHPDLFTGDSLSGFHLSKSPRSFISGVTIPSSGTPAQREAKFSGKHAPHLLFILDEGDAIPDEVYKGIESCMSGGWARLLVLFNPRSEMGAAYKLEIEHKANIVHLSAFAHPNVIHGTDIIPGAVTRETTVRRINEWTRRLVTGKEDPDEYCFVLPDFLVGIIAKDKRGIDFPPLQAGTYKITDPAFSYMVLGEYPSQGSNQLISREWINKARARYDVYIAQNGENPPKGTIPIHGQDVAEFGSDYNVSCFRYGGYVEPLIKWNGVDTLVTGERSARLAKEKKASVTNVDATGVGAGVAPVLIRNGQAAARIMVASKPTRSIELGEFSILRDQLLWAVREWLRIDPGAMLPPDDELIEELVVPTYEVQSGKIQVMKKKDMRKQLGRSPDSMDALALTFYEAPAPGIRLI